MSKTQKSESRSRSRSASRSRSRSDSRSRSRSQSSSRSRTRKRRYVSRSRSRSRSHSPPHNRERNHTREYQNQREFRGNHRGFRRPYYFRGRGQGFFRGRFQRGGRGGYNNYRHKNWQNFRQHPQHQQQQYHGNSPKRGRSRSPKKQSNSPQPRSHSRRSDRSSSGRSPQSHHSSSSNSGSAKRICKNAREDISVPEEIRGGGDGALAEQVGSSPAAEGNSDGDRTVEKCQVLMNHDTSPKKASPQVCSTVTSDQPIDSSTNETSPAHNAPHRGATTWQNVETAPSNTSPIKKSLTPVFNGFGLFTNIDQQTDDTIAISAAFLKFLKEQELKKQASAWDDNTHKEKSNGDVIRGKENGEMFEKGIELSRIVDHDNAGEKEKTKSAKSADGNKLSISSTKRGSRNGPTFLCEDGEDDDEEMEIFDKVRDVENDPSKSKSKVTLSAREMFEKRIRKMKDMAWDDELEALLLCHKQERAANILAALSKRDQLSGIFKDPSPEKLSNVKRKEKTTLSSSSKPTLLPRRSSENREQEMFVVMNEESPPRTLMKRGSEFSVRMDSLSDNLARTSVLTNERRNLLDFLHLDKKDWEFQSVLQHLQAQQSPKSPSELFAQHIVSIVHHIKAQYFPSSGLTLNDRFAMYQRKAAEKEFMKQRKSPEIHRRIDVSPSAFKRHSLLFDEMKSSMENSFKVDAKKSKGDPMDLRLDIERRKKYLSGEREEEYGGRVLRESPDSSKEIPTEKISKSHKKPKKSKKKREHSESSSSSSSSSSVYQEEEAEIQAESFSKVQQGLRDYAESAERGQARGGFLRIRSRTWNRGNFHGSSNGDSQMNLSAKNDDWDQEYTPKSKKYFLHSEKDVEAEKKLMDTRGRGRGNAIRAKGRFILRRATNANTTNTSPKWAHDKFQVTDDDEGEQQGDDVEQDQ
ncbi:thyroid hormone receptor-associated protein 3 isoform X2 [Garra rufa]|uniref:thyroid hormone receptor-associated protein 3 isoform X2 n=1 Tax=Garra rufa TaxID=137080 RepID=UPI003CCEBB3A